MKTNGLTYVQDNEQKNNMIYIKKQPLIFQAPDLRQAHTDVAR